MASKPKRPDQPQQSTDADAERLGVELREQVRTAKERISDRYVKLVQSRTREGRQKPN